MIIIKLVEEKQGHSFIFLLEQDKNTFFQASLSPCYQNYLYGFWVSNLVGTSIPSEVINNYYFCSKRGRIEVRSWLELVDISCNSQLEKIAVNQDKQKKTCYRYLTTVINPVSLQLEGAQQFSAWTLEVYPKFENVQTARTSHGSEVSSLPVSSTNPRYYLNKQIAKEEEQNWIKFLSKKLAKNCLDRAIRIATDAYKQQNDKTGKPRLDYYLRIMNCFEDTDRKIIAVLHNILLDLKTTVLELCFSFPDDLALSIYRLKQQEQETYCQYIDRLIASEDLNAISVKIEIVKNRLDTCRFSSSQQREVYVMALKRLREKIEQKY